jgi:hypothetical protein
VGDGLGTAQRYTDRDPRRDRPWCLSTGNHAHEEVPTYSILAKLRDYNGATDLASVELEELGGIDFWLDSLAVDGSLNRALLTHGVPVTLTVPDEHRLPEAVITAIGQQPANPTTYAGTTLQRIQYGRGIIATDGAGAGSFTVTFPAGFAATPANLYAASDDGHVLTLSAITSVHFTATVAGGPVNSYVAFSWHASGNH